MQHDGSYKLLFSHPEMVADLMRGFVREDWVEQLDFSTLEKANGHYVSDELTQREDDVVWRLRFRDGWLYVYLLLEFQSVVDPWMALRMLVYVGLLYQDLVRRKQLTENGLLPPVLPIVLYNGESRWNAVTDVIDLIEPVNMDLERYLPRQRYFIIDEKPVAASIELEAHNLADALFRLEHSRTPEDLAYLVQCLNEWLHNPNQTSLRRAFASWIKQVLLPSRVPGIEIEALNDLQEVQNMLAERVKTWTDEWKNQGMLEGIQEGKREGKLEGMREGKLEGMREGKLEGESVILKRILQRRFGELPEWVVTRISQATLNEIETWVDRVLDAPTLDDVFQS